MPTTYEYVKAVATDKANDCGYDFSSIMPVKGDLCMAEEMLEQGIPAERINRYIVSAMYLERSAKARQAAKSARQGDVRLSADATAIVVADAMTNDLDGYTVAVVAGGDAMLAYLNDRFATLNPANTDDIGLPMEDVRIIQEAWRGKLKARFGKESDDSE